jgi:hypothetical protein
MDVNIYVYRCNGALSTIALSGAWWKLPAAAGAVRVVQGSFDSAKTRASRESWLRSG